VTLTKLFYRLVVTPDNYRGDQGQNRQNDRSGWKCHLGGEKQAISRRNVCLQDQNSIIDREIKVRLTNQADKVGGQFGYSAGWMTIPPARWRFRRLIACFSRPGWHFRQDWRLIGPMVLTLIPP